MAEDVLDREDTDEETDVEGEGDGEAGSPEELAAITPNPHSPITPLTMPTTVAKLRAWLLSVDTIGPAGTAVVAASATSITVA